MIGQPGGVEVGQYLWQQADRCARARAASITSSNSLCRNCGRRTPGGLRAYRRKCTEVAESGYEGFVLTSRDPAAIASAPRLR